MIEKKYLEVPSQTFTANGNTGGLVQVADTSLFKVKQNVRLFSNTRSPISGIEIKTIVSPTQMLVGPKGGAMIDNYIDTSSFLVADGASISAPMQERPTISQPDSARAVYEEEPTVALRTIMVDKYGNRYDSTNRIPVDATVTIPSVTTRRLTSNDDDPLAGDIHDSIRIGDGVNELGINADKSINVNVLSGGGSVGTTKNPYNSATVATGVLTTITTYTVPALKTAILEKISASGENIARFSVLVNGTEIDALRTYFGGPFNVKFDFISRGSGYQLVASDIVTVKVFHTRPSLGIFEARIQIVESS